MIILAHRGIWQIRQEQNSSQSIVKSVKHGFGIETDLRDYCGKIVISHDPPISDGYSFEDLLHDVIRNADSKIWLALNVKADGLSSLVQKKLQEFRVENYFFFDMSIPDAKVYIDKKMNIFTRQSEAESKPVFYTEAMGIWMDEFYGHWITDEIVETHLRNGKKICLVSPELHGRNHMMEWNHYRKMQKKFGSEDFMICTDYPKEAKEFFND